jgi:hypothetical protein
MPLEHCAHHCQHYGKCWHVLWALRAYESVNGEKHPAEKALWSYGYPPACLKAHPPDRRAMGPGGTNS